jgi:hypothetical protein
VEHFSEKSAHSANFSRNFRVRQRILMNFPKFWDVFGPQWLKIKKSWILANFNFHFEPKFRFFGEKKFFFKKM